MTIINRVAHYPAPFRVAIERIVKCPSIGSIRKISRKAKVVCDIGTSLKIDRSVLSKDEIFWAGSPVGPCTLSVMSEVETHGRVGRVVVSHSSVSEVSYRIPALLQEHRFKPKNTAIMLAGMGGRSSIYSLDRTCQALTTNLNNLGFPCELFWPKKDYPHLENPQVGYPKFSSDIGLWINHRNDSNLARYAFVGITTEEVILFSFHWNMDTGKIEELSLLTRNQWRIPIIFCPN
jgi:hypothetical protein